jgi:hypothetical protein
MSEPHTQRPRIAQRIHDLLLHELGEHIDVGLMLGPVEYARAVLSLCRGSRVVELHALAEEFTRVSQAEALGERARGDRMLVGLGSARAAAESARASRNALQR